MFNQRNSTIVALALLAVCFVATLPTGVAAATNTTNTTCVASLSCGSCVGGSVCGYCKSSSQCQEGTAAGSFSGCTGGNWSWFIADCNCTYVCPDSTCASSLSACACTQQATINNAAVAVWPLPATVGEAIASDALTFTASANYRQLTGSCSSFDFGPFMTVQWMIKIGAAAETSLPASIPSNRSTLSFAAKYFTVGTAYTLTARFYKIDNTVGASIAYSFTARAPAPTVSLTTRGSKLIVGPRNIRLTAVIVDMYPDNSNATWTCTGTCGTALLNALSANGTNTGVFIAGPVLAGTSTLTITYKTVTSDPLTLVVSSVDVPTVSVLSGTAPVVAPNTYLYSQAITLAALVSFTEATTLAWRIGGTSYSSSAYFVIPMWALTAGSNTVTLRAAAASNASLYGESTFDLVLAANQTLSISSISNSNQPTTPTAPLVALSDSAVVTYTSSALSGAVQSFSVGYLSNNLKIRLARSTTMSASFVCPMPFGTTLPVYVEMYLGDIVAATAYLNRSVTLPETNAAITNQLSALSASTDPLARAQSAANLGALLSRGGASNAASVSVSVVDALAQISTSAGVPQAIIFGALRAALGATNNTDALANNTKLIARNLIGNLKAEDGRAFLDVVTAVKADAEIANLINDLASALGASAGLNEVVTVESNGNIASGTKVLAGNIAAAAGNIGTSRFVFAAVPGLSDDPSSTVVIGSAESTTNAFGKFNGQEPTTKGISLGVKKNGSPFVVAGLTTPIKITLQSTNPATDRCLYMDTTTNTWSSAGLTKSGFTATTIECSTTHLTSFAGFAGSSSSSARVFVSAAVIAIAALLQLVLRF